MRNKRLQGARCGKAARRDLWGAGLRKGPVYPTALYFPNSFQAARRR